MRRREFLGVVGGAAAWPVMARAKQGERTRRIGVLSARSADWGCCKVFLLLGGWLWQRHHLLSSLTR